MNKTKKTNNLYKRPLTRKKPISYANALKRNTPMKIEKVKLVEWLKYYNIPIELLETLSVSNNTKFLYNTDLLDYFFSEQQFFDFVASKLRTFYKINKKTKKNRSYTDKFKETLYKLVDAFHFLFNQKLEYNLYFSNFGDNSKESLDAGIKVLLKTTKFKEILKKDNLNSEEIIKKIKLLTIDNLNKFKISYCLSYFLSNDYEVLRQFINITKQSKLNFKNGLKPNMNKRELYIFLENNKSLKLLEICENKFKLKDIIKNLMIYTSKELIDLDESYYIYEMISPEENEKKYKRVANIIYSIFFPCKTIQYIENNYKKLLSIPRINTSLKKSKLRIFIISGHGPCYTPGNYKKIPKVDFSNIIGITRKKNIKILSSQPYGRLASTYLPLLFAKIFDFEYSKLFEKALWFSETKDDFNKLEDLLNFLFFYFNDNKYTPGDKNSTEVKFEKWKKEQTSLHNKHYKMNPSGKNSTIFDFVKYNYINPPKDTLITFSTNRSNEEIKGIFEITENTSDTLKLFNLVSDAYIPSFKNKMGLDLEKLYERHPNLLPNNLNEITKYNYHLLWKYGNENIESGLTLTISQIIKSIYEVLDLNYNEKILLLFNQCRGAIHTSQNNSEWNTIKRLSPNTKSEALAMRVASQEMGYSSVIE